MNRDELKRRLSSCSMSKCREVWHEPVESTEANSGCPSWHTSSSEGLVNVRVDSRLRQDSAQDDTGSTEPGWCGQANKGARWMSWRQEAMKDVGTCDKPRGAGNRASILGFPNGATRPKGHPRLNV